MNIAVDMDGTLCEESNYPQIGNPKTGVIKWCKKQQDAGHKLILWTVRQGQLLTDAVNWCKQHEIKFDYIGQGKICADIYLDDKGLRCEGINAISDVVSFRRG